MSTPRTLRIAPDVDMPILGLGTWQMDGEQCRSAVTEAVSLGYRHIDTALMYGNQRKVARGITDSDVDRSDIFITSKIWRDRLDREGVYEQADTILDELNTDYVDLLLIHWPNRNFSIHETLAALTELQEAGKTRTIGVSNFTREHLEEALVLYGNIAVNQVEYHPSLNQESLREFCEEHGITVTAYSPFKQGVDLEAPEIQSIAAAYDVPASQVVLNWLMRKGISVIPRSAKPDHLRDNFAALEWDLTTEDMAAIDAMQQGNRLVYPGFAEFE